MELTLFTSRLKLTLIQTAERGSPELEWMHEIRSDEQANFWRYDIFIYEGQRSSVHLTFVSISWLTLLQKLYGAV